MSLWGILACMLDFHGDSVKLAAKLVEISWISHVSILSENASDLENWNDMASLHKLNLKTGGQIPQKCEELQGSLMSVELHWFPAAGNLASYLFKPLPRKWNCEFLLTSEVTVRWSADPQANIYKNSWTLLVPCVGFPLACSFVSLHQI